jgi:multidrug efflux pump subunit AcrB
MVGAPDREIQVNLDMFKMQSLQMGMQDVERTIGSENITITGGQIPMDGTKRTLSVKNEFHSIDELKNLIIKNTNNNTTNNTTNNTHTLTNINVKLKNFGWENMKALPESLVSTLFMDLRFRELLANLHCDPNFPENQNVRIKSVKRNTMEIYRNNKWDIVSFTTGLQDLLLQGHKIFIDYYKKDRKRILEEDMDEGDLRDILYQLKKIEELNKSEIKPFIEDLQLMLEEYRQNGHAIILA